MTTLRLLLVLTVAVGVAVLGTVVSASKTTPPPISATATFRDVAGQAVKSDGIVDTYLSSLTASYTTADYVDGVDDTSETVGTGNATAYYFSLHAVSSPGARRLCFDFAASNTLTGPVLPEGNTPCLDVVGGLYNVLTGTSSVPLPSLVLNQQTHYRFHIGWVGTDGGIQYQYHFAYGRDWNGDGTPDTLPALVTCTAANAAGSCTTWLVTPDSTGGWQASLSRQELKNGVVLEAEQLIGFYSMPFALTLVRK